MTQDNSKRPRTLSLAFPVTLFVFVWSSDFAIAAGRTDDPLPSWNQGFAKQRIVQFVQQVTCEDDPRFVSTADRVATLDNDGTLWAEKPLYFQLAFAFDRLRETGKADVRLAEQRPIKAIFEADRRILNSVSRRELFRAIMGTEAEMTPAEFNVIARRWLASTKHPRFNRAYIELVYQPMLELITYLQAHEFKVFIVSGGGLDFVRAISEKVYGIPRENVVGSHLAYRFEMTVDGPRILRTPRLGSFNDGAAKPANIALHIGRRPILAFGNSDGDIEMLQYAEIKQRPWISLLLHHDDPEREFAYTKGAEKAIKLATQRGWQVVSMGKDFKTVFPTPRN